MDDQAQAGKLAGTADQEGRRTVISAVALCAEVLSTIDRIFVAVGPDEPDLGFNVAYVTTRQTLARLASAKDWELSMAVADSIRSRLRAIASVTDPVQLERELLSFPSWVLRSLDRRRARRHARHEALPRRREGDRLWLPTEISLHAKMGQPGAS